MFKLESFSTPGEWYTIDPDHESCSCPAFLKTGHCKHLDTVGIYRPRNWLQGKYPGYTQALSALVKSIRIRNVQEAVYWTVYLHPMFEKGARFRTARRMLIGSAEDGMSVAVMEKTASNFGNLAKSNADVVHWVAEVIRLCKVPNWWGFDEGHSFVEQALIGKRADVIYKKSWSQEEAMKRMESCLALGDTVGAMGAFLFLCENDNMTPLATHLSDLAKESGSETAQRLMSVHLSQAKALSGDNNFCSQAVWWMAGNEHPYADAIEVVTRDEVFERLVQARKDWETPHLIPGWCCDGMHSSGTDRRFCGMWIDMAAACRSAKHYGTLSPDNKWLPEFYTRDGLHID